MASGYTKKYYKIREVTDILGLPAPTLRFWEQEFPELKPKRSNHNQRLYTPEDLELLEIIRFLLHKKGYKIEAAREYLSSNRHNISKRLQIIKKLEEMKEDLQNFEEVLSIRVQKMNFLYDLES